MADSFNLKAIISTVDRATPGLKAIGKAAQGTRKYLIDIGNAASGFATKLGLPIGLLSGLAAGFSIGAIKNAMVSFANAGEAIYKGSLKAGMGVEEYQRWNYVALQSGVEAESLTMAMGKLNRNIGMAAAGKNKDLSGLFQRLGLSARDANGELKSSSELLPAIADAFKRNTNPVVQARMGMALFGKAWQDMAPLLMEGGEGIDKMQKRFKLLKSAMDLDTVKGAKEFGDQLKDVEIVTKGFQMTIAKELVPVLSPLIEEFIQWAAANRKVVASGVKEFVRDFITTVKSIDWAGVVASVKGFGSSLMSAVEFVGGFRNALIGLVVVMNAQTILAFGGLIASVLRMTWAFGSMLVPAIGSTIAFLVPLELGFVTLAAAAGLFVAQLAAIAAVGLAAYAGVKWIMDITGAAQWLSDKISSWSGIDQRVADALGPTGPGTGGAAPLVGPAQKAQVGGTVTVDFKNAPAGMRVEQAQGTGGLMLDPNVGYRSFATGGA